MDHHQLLDRLRSARFAEGVRCPSCGCERIHRWGSFAGRQRYRCRSCRRTFSDLTGTPAAYLKKLHLLPAYADCMTQRMSIRKCATVVGLHPATAFRWRHRLCRVLAQRRERLTGWIEIVVVNLPESEKGQRRLSRAARRHRWDRALVLKDPVRVIVAADRHGRIAAGAAGRTRLRERDLEGVIGPSIGSGRPVVVALEGRLGPVRRFALSRGGSFQDARSGRRRRGLAHIQLARAHVRRFVQWLVRFRGVATRYLDHYLAWHRTLDLGLRHGLRESVLRWPQGSLIPIHSSSEQNVGGFDGTPSFDRPRAPRGSGARPPLVSHPSRSII
jgi:transposase-like protein